MPAVCAPATAVSKVSSARSTCARRSHAVRTASASSACASAPPATPVPIAIQSVDGLALWKLAQCDFSYFILALCTKDPNFNFWDHYSTCPDPAGCFSIFQHGWFNGMEAKFPVGDFNVDSIGYLNNQMSSFKLPAGLKVQMFDGENFNGHSITVNGGMDADVAKLQSLGFSNDMLSSMKVYSA